MLESHHHLSLSLLYAGFKRVETWWNFQDVISPFYRLYYIREGEGTVYINQTPHKLVANQLFLIPKFAFHSYECEDFMDHYYICFFDDMAGKKGIRNPTRLNFQVQASEFDFSLICRYMQLNPGKELATPDPKRYDNDRMLYEKQPITNVSRQAADVESDGILLQLFSRFMTDASMQNPIANNLYEKLDQVIHFINNSLDERISVSDLADRMCVTPDHCSRIFKKIIGVAPCEYIQMKRIERAQILLLTTQLPILQIAERVGIHNLSQFSRLFSKLSGCSPREYRVMQLERIG